jgi:hypothetical protein
LGVGVTPSAKIHALATTEQLRLGYHASNYLSATVASNGDTTIALTGTTPVIKIGTDTIFSGSGVGLPYGSCYGKDIAWTQASAAQDTWYLVSDTDMVDSELNLMTHDGSGKLTATKAGRYLFNMAISFECSGVAKHLEYGMSINGADPAMYQREYFGATAQEQHGSLTRILSLAANDTVELKIRTTDTGTPDITVTNLSITSVQVGG